MAAINNTLAALTGVALALPGVMPRNALANGPILTPEAEFNYAHYNENGNRMSVDIYQISAKSSLGDQLELSFSGVKDVISGASPVYNRPQVTYAPAQTVTTRVPKSAVNTISGASWVEQPIVRPPVVIPPVQPGIDLPAEPEPVTPGPGPTPIPAPTPAPSQPVYEPPQYQLGPTEQVFTPINFNDERHAFDLGLNYYVHNFMISLSGGASHEQDYLSNYGSLSVQGEFNDKLTTVSAGFSYADDTISPVTRRFDNKSKQTQQYILSVSQVLSKSALWQGNISFGAHDGFLSDPYKKAFVADYGLVDDQRPDRRFEWSFYNRFVYYIKPLDAALHLDYRYAFNDWRIDSHLFQLSWHQPIIDQWQIVTNFRYYTQSDAKFYRPWFETRRLDNFYSSDYRMARFGALSGGVKLSKLFFSHLQVDAGIEYYKRQSTWAFNGNSDNSFADYSFTIASITLNYKF
ncbi:MAG: hypothetical protein Kow0065_22310 [Methylomicrobium sp.]